MERDGVRPLTASSASQPRALGFLMSRITNMMPARTIAIKQQSGSNIVIALAR
jgi:hypothetical protein